MTALVVAVALLWVLVATLTVLVVLLYRQFGLIYIGSKARLALTGLAVGAKVPAVAHLRMAGRALDWNWNEGVDGRGTIAIFGAPACPLCQKLTPQLNLFADAWGDLATLIFIERGPLPTGPTHDVLGRTQWMYAEDPDGKLHEAFDIEAFPYAFVVDSSRRVLSKGIVNNVSDLEGVLSRAVTDERTLRTDVPGTEPLRSETADGEGAMAAQPSL